MLVKFIAPNLNLKPSIAVVGSSGRMTQAESGERIDKYDEVIRFNRAPVTGWEKHVGAKTTLRVLNRPVFASAPLLRWRDDQFFVRALREQRLLVHSSAQNLLAERDQYCDPSNEIFVLRAGAIKKDPLCAGIVPSIGFSTVVALVRSGLKPHVYGFGIDPKHPLTHYWHKRPPNSISHRFDIEIAQLASLAKDGLIVQR